MLLYIFFILGSCLLIYGVAHVLSSPKNFFREFNLERNFAKAVKHFSQYGKVSIEKKEVRHSNVSDVVYRIRYYEAENQSSPEYLVRHANLIDSEDPVKEEKKAIKNLKLKFINAYIKELQTLPEYEHVF